MNRQRYRLVFNRPRGQWMAVAEIASGLRPHGGSACGGTATAGLLPSVLRFSLLAVSVALTMNTVAHAQILGDRNAPRNQQPTVLVTPNGVPVVNIQTPSTAGVSLNSYRQFDVGARGAILNNARSTTATQLGGYVAGNPWLATGAARVIVNQVNSANPSYLRGYLEVAGARAQVVVANAAGISCAGCGFLNASRATLTTGVPQIVSGQLESYRVARGAVRIEGNGMDGSRTDYAEIIARAVQVNAGIWAPELKVSTGLNTVSADHTSVVPGVAATEAAPAVAIDVPQLGGMYAGHIYLSATEHGVGVRNAGAIGASVGQAVVTADGRLENSGSLTAKGLLTVQTSDGISNTGELGSQSAARLATSALDNRGSIVSAGALNVQASGALQNSGSIGGEGKVQMSAASIDNRSSIGSSTDLALQASADMRNSGQVKAAQSVDLKVGSLDNSGGLIRSDATVHVQAAVLRNDDTLAKDQGMEGATVSVAAAEISNRQGAMRGDAITLVADSRIDNQGGLISATRSATLSDANPSGRALVIDNDKGTVIAGQQTSVLAYSFTGDGRFLSQKDLRIDLVGSILHTGQIGASGDLDLRTTGRFANAGAVGAGGTLMLTAATIDNRASGSLVGNSVRLKATDIHTFINRGVIDGVNTVIESSTVNNLGTGRIYGDNVAVGADVLNNQAETVDGVTSAPVIAARKRLDIGAGVINNSEHALIYSVGDMVIGGALDTDKKASGSARELNNSSATINAEGNLTIAAGTLNNTNAHLETTDQTRPGNRIINFRLNGSSQLLDSNSAWLYNRGSGEILNAADWRAMGDEDNYRLLLPSTAYPAERYGPPFDYSRGARGDDAVAIAYVPAYSQGTMGDADAVYYPAIINYTSTDRVWSVMGVTPPEDPGAGPGAEPRPGEMCYESCVQVPLPAGVHEAWKSAYDVWKPKYDAYVAALLVLNDKITAFNNNVNSRSYREWTIYDGTEQITRTVVTRSDPGMITAGGNMNLVAGSVNNYASQFIAGGTVAGDSVNGTTINNTGPLGRQRVVSTGSASYTYVKSHSFSADDRRYDNAPYVSQEIVTYFPLDITPTNGAGPNHPASIGSASIRIANLDLTLPNNALFQINAGPVQRYLVQTDPQFVGTRSWLSSDYMLNQLGITNSVRQLGDGFYEQQLIQRQVQQITGQRYLSGYSSNEAQYQALMNAGVQAAQASRYTVGVALTDAQIAELKTDIVWLVKQTVTLDDGSTQEVLMPQVYIHASNVEVTGQGTLIAGNDVAFQTAQDIVNSGGTIAGRQSVSLAGNNVQNLGGRISGGAVTVAAAQDVNNIGGTIDARTTLVATAGRDINSAATTVATANAVTSGTNISQNASMSVSGSNGALTAVAGRDINLKASSTSADNATLVAQRDVNLSTVHETSQEKITWDKDNRAEVNRDNAIGSTVQGKEISVTAGRDINAQAAYVNAEGSLSATAANNINIGTDVSTASARDQHKKSDSGGMLASRTVTTDDSSSQAINQGTTFSGNTVAVRAGNDINVKGSNVVSTLGTGMVAGNDVNIVAAVDSNTKSNFRQERTSGVMGSGFGVTIGTREQSHDGKTQDQTASASTVGSTDGNVSVVAGNRYAQVGSDVLAPKGDVDIAAKSVEIRAAEQASKSTTEDKYKQSGLTVAVTSPVISAIQTVGQMAEAASKTKDGRVKALAAATAGMSAYSAVGEMQKGATEGSANIGISATIGSSQNSNRTEQNTVTQRGSALASGGNMSIRATGDGTNSNITIAGSDINAKGDLALRADNDINLIAAQNSDEQHSNRSSSSWGVGITAQIGSQSKLGFTANAAGSRGNSDGKDVSNVMTQVRAGGQVNIDSGRDTNLVGAIVSGEKVVANVGRDLNIASVQDTSSFKSRDQSIGGSATIGYGSGASVSASRSRVDADYASVGQQAGITAGNGGFQINVKGNTDLKGAQIASTDQAVEQGKNSLITGTLTSSELQNRSQYSAQSQSVSAGTSGGKPGGGIGIGNASGSETSVTRSGVSGGAVTIKDAQAQQAKTGQSPDQAVASLDTSVRTGKDSSNSLAKNWDGNQLREDVEAQAKITQAFGQQASKLIGDYAEQQQKKAADLRTQANAATDPAAAKELNDQASALESNWGPNGTMRVLAHTIVGGLTGGLAGAAGAAAGTLTAPNVASALDKAGVDPELAKALTGLSSTLVGAAVGGTAGGAAAYNEVVNNFLGHADRERLNKLRGKAQSKERLTNDEALQLVFLEVSDQISDGLLNKYRSGQPLTKFEQQNLAIYLGGYSQQNGKEATQQLIQNGSAPSYTFPYAGSSSDRGDYAGKNFKWLDYFYRDPGTNESIFNDARAKAGIYPNVTPYESLTPVGMQWSRFFSVVDSIANSSLATGTYLGATLAGASADTRDGLTIAMGQLAQIGASFMLPKAGISPAFGKTSADIENPRSEPKISKVDEEIDSLRNIAARPNGPNLNDKEPGTILVQQQQKRLDEVADLFNKSTTNNAITINGVKVEATPMGTEGGSNLSGSTKVLESQNLTDQQILGYAQQLAGKSPLEQKTPSVWVADLGGGQTVTLRSVSSSQGATGARWTIDLRGSPQLQNINSSIKQFELKFR